MGHRDWSEGERWREGGRERDRQRDTHRQRHTDCRAQPSIHHPPHPSIHLFADRDTRTAVPLCLGFRVGCLRHGTDGHGRETHADRDTRTETHTQRHTQTETRRLRQTQTETYTDRDTQTETHTQKDTHRQRHTDSHAPDDDERSDAR